MEMVRWALVAVLGGAVGWGTQTRPVKTVELLLKDERSSTAVVGVCSADADATTCWDGAGHRDKALTDRVMRSLAKATDVPDFEVRPGTKLRFVIVESTVNFRSGGRRQADLHPSMSRDSFMWSRPLRTETVEEGEDVQITNLTMYAVSVDQSAQKGSVFLCETKTFLGTKRLEPLSGSSCQVGDWTVTLHGFAPAPDEAVDGRGTRRKAWKMELSLEGPTGAPSLGFSFEDKKHEYIRLVDATGKPATERQFQEQMKTPEKPQRIVYPNTALDTRGSLGKATSRLLVDPSVIGGIGVSGSLDEWTEIAGIPMEPSTRDAGGQ